MHQHTLEPGAQAFADATSQAPFLYGLGPEGARKVPDDVQAAPMARESDQHIPGSVEMSASFTPYHVGSDAYIRVRVPNGPRPDGSILVYLTNGTAFLVNGEELLHFDTGKNAPNASDDGPLSSAPHGLTATHPQATQRRPAGVLAELTT